MPEPRYRLSLARNEADIADAQRLRYAVFVEELGGDGPLVDHAARREADRFDAHADHLILRDAAGGGAVGVYRLLREEAAAAAGGFYTEGEYDLAPLRASGRRLLELGRSCVDVRHRGGMAMMHLWQGLAVYAQEHGIELMFGVASFHGTDVASLAPPLSLLHHRHLAPPPLRVRARERQRMDLMPADGIDRTAAMRAVPPLIKAYLRLGGFVGDGAFVDQAFNTTDVCVLLDTARLNPRRSALYLRGVS